MVIYDCMIDGQLVLNDFSPMMVDNDQWLMTVDIVVHC
jgi:hypothetical protein